MAVRNLHKFNECVNDIIHQSYAVLSISDELENCFEAIRESFSQVSDMDKRNFSFPQFTEGFLPFGLEYSMIPDHPDLCERYCYWPNQKARHEKFSFTNSAFYRTVVKYEQGISVLADHVLNEIHDYYGAPRQIPTRESSYLQYCAYLPQFRSDDREFLQDPHEDGHLLSFIKPSCAGLMIMCDGAFQPLEIGKNEIGVLAGSLLTALSDEQIPAKVHAVAPPPENVARQSLMYFVNPHPSYMAKTLQSGRLLNLQSFANERHKSFGNPDLV